jgi:hypothetical protein
LEKALERLEHHKVPFVNQPKLSTEGFALKAVSQRGINNSALHFFIMQATWKFLR